MSLGKAHDIEGMLEAYREAKTTIKFGNITFPSPSVDINKLAGKGLNVDFIYLDDPSYKELISKMAKAFTAGARAGGLIRELIVIADGAGVSAAELLAMHVDQLNNSMKETLRLQEELLKNSPNNLKPEKLISPANFFNPNSDFKRKGEKRRSKPHWHKKFK